MISRLRNTYQEFPLRFWILVLSAFIDRIGGTMVFPFFALYITERFDVGMTEAGVLSAIFSVSGLVGSMFGGALTDRFGRRGMVLFGLVFSALSSVSMGLVGKLSAFYGLAVLVGLLSNIGGPAQQAMVADMLPQEKHSEGYGVLRVAGNLAWILGPTIGGFLALRSYLYLFVLDAITSVITAVILFRLVPETRPASGPDQAQEPMLKTFAGYGLVLRDGLFMAFLATAMLMLIVYQQMYNTLSVYLRDVHGVSARGYGWLLSLDAAVVVLLQFWVARRTRRHPPMLMMMLGTLFYMVGFTLYGFVSSYPLFVVAILIITVGEMIELPVGQALVARFAPEAMRGRYMAVFGIAWTVPAAVGPWAAGLIIDNYDPNWVWYAGGLISAAAAAGFYLLHLRTKARLGTETMEPSTPGITS